MRTRQEEEIIKKALAIQQREREIQQKQQEEIKRKKKENAKKRASEKRKAQQVQELQQKEHQRLKEEKQQKIAKEFAQQLTLLTQQISPIEEEITDITNNNKKRKSFNKQTDFKNNLKIIVFIHSNFMVQNLLHIQNSEESGGGQGYRTCKSKQYYCKLCESDKIFEYKNCNEFEETYSQL